MPEIRPIRASDIPAFHALLDAVCRERRFLSTLVAPSLPRVQDFVCRNIEHGHPQLVALDEAGDRLIGWCDILSGDPESGSAHVGRMGMGVDKAHRGRGVGRALAKAALQAAAEFGLEKVELAVYTANHGAIALYRSLGFQEEGCRRRGRLVDGVYDDILLMGLML